MNFAIRATNLAANTNYQLRDLQDLSIDWDNSSGFYYTLIIYDIDATSSPIVHYLVSNIPNNDINAGVILFSYMPPNPPFGSHRYRIDLYRQGMMITEFKIKDRSRFPLNSFIRQHRLKLVASETLIADRDTFYIDRPKLSINSKHPLLRGDTSLNEREQAFCSCVVDVAAKQPGNCNLEKAWFEQRDGRECYNPYAICAKSTGTSTRGCLKEYNYDNMTDNELQSLAYLHNITVASPINRNDLINIFQSKV